MMLRLGTAAVLSGGMLVATWTNAPNAYELQGSTDLSRWQTLSYHLRISSKQQWGRVEFEFPVTNGLSFYRLHVVD